MDEEVGGKKEEGMDEEPGRILTFGSRLSTGTKRAETVLPPPPTRSALACKDPQYARQFLQGGKEAGRKGGKEGGRTMTVDDDCRPSTGKKTILLWKGMEDGREGEVEKGEERKQGEHPTS